MATLNYNVNVNTAQGVQALQNLQNQVAKTSGVFESMKSAVAGFAAASFITGLYKMANEITDMAAATGVGTQAILGFGKAVSANGGTMEGATTGIAKFVQKIGEAADGSKEAQDTFLKMGISLQDLRTMSEEDLLKKAVASFKEGMSASEKLTMAVTLFGKAARSWDMSKINSELATYIAKSKDASDATDAAGEVSQRFSNVYGEFKTRLLVALEPLSKLALLILENKQAISAFLGVVANLAMVLGTLAVIKKTAGFFDDLVRGLSAAMVAFRTGGAGIKGFTGTASELGIGLRYLGQMFDLQGMMAVKAGAGIGVLRQIFTSFTSGLVRLIPFIGQVASAFLILNGIIEAFTGKSVIGWLKEGAQALGFFKDETDKSGQASQNQTEQLRAVNDAMAKQREELNKIVAAYNEANSAANARYEQETKLLGLGELSKETYQKQLDSYGRYVSEYNKLRDQFNAAQASTSPSEQGMAGGIAAKMTELTASYQKQIAADEALAKARVEMNRATNLSNFETKALIESQNKLQEIQDQIAKSTMSTIEQKYYDIEAAARASAKAAIEAEEARRNEKMPIEEQKAYYDAALQGSEDLKKKTEEGYVVSRKWSTGWTKAFNDYRDNATNAAEEAGRVFNIMAQGMEDALMGFIKKGTFAWKDFVQLMVDELLRSQIRQLIGNLGSIGSSASSGIGSLLGFASGGIIPTNGPVVVGERGPELLMGAAGMNVVPNNQLGGATNVVYNISAVDAMSFKAMIARDPTFLYAVTEQGRRSLPGGR